MRLEIHSDAELGRRNENENILKSENGNQMMKPRKDQPSCRLQCGKVYLPGALRTQAWLPSPGAVQIEFARTCPRLTAVEPCTVSFKQAEHLWVAMLAWKNDVTKCLKFIPHTLGKKTSAPKRKQKLSSRRSFRFRTNVTFLSAKGYLSDWKKKRQGAKAMRETAGRKEDGFSTK